MPDPVRVVIVNATPIIALSLIGNLDILSALYNQVLVPPAVETEVLTGGKSKIGVGELQKSGWICVTPLQDPRRADLLSDLDRGEAEVIALAQEINADLVIIDERLARRHAGRLGLTLTGTLGVLLRAKQKNLIPSISPLIEVLQKNGIRLGEPLITKTLRLAGEV